jgi:hypothetical protein
MIELFFFFSLKKKEKNGSLLNTCRYVSASFQTTPISFKYKARKGEQKKKLLERDGCRPCYVHGFIKKNKPTSIYHSQTDDEVCSFFLLLLSLSAAKLVNKLSFFTHIPPIEVNPFLGLRLAAAAAGVER